MIQSIPSITSGRFAINSGCLWIRHLLLMWMYQVKDCNKNIIDSYTQPFYGLVEFARREPETVQQMFIDLYSDDGGDVNMQMELIKNFFDQSNELLDKYFSDSHLYKQNSHSVSSYLFLYDPDHQLHSRR